VLVDERAGVRDYEVLDLRGSDHRAVYAEVALGPARAGMGAVRRGN
jgi:hypothetical protein